MELEVIKENGEVTKTMILSYTSGGVSYESVPYSGYFMYEGYKIVFVLDGKTIVSLTEVSTGGSAVTSLEVAKKTTSNYINVFLKKIEKAEKEGRDFHKVVSDFKKVIAEGLAKNNKVKPIENNSIDLWQISVLL